MYGIWIQILYTFVQFSVELNGRVALICVCVCIIKFILFSIVSSYDNHSVIEQDWNILVLRGHYKLGQWVLHARSNPRQHVSTHVLISEPIPVHSSSTGRCNCSMSLDPVTHFCTKSPVPWACSLLTLGPPPAPLRTVTIQLVFDVASSFDVLF